MEPMKKYVRTRKGKQHYKDSKEKHKNEQLQDPKENFRDYLHP